MAVKNLNLFYGSFQALKDISLDVAENEVTALIGPSGCGKSSLLRSLNRMNDIAEDCRMTGRIYLDGSNIYDINANHLRRRVGMVFQSPNPFRMSIYDNVAYGPRAHGIRRRSELDGIVERSLKSAALWGELRNCLKKPAAGLSGGQQQRLCIARALAAEPEVLLMDEPTSALDPVSTARIEELIAGLRRKYTVVIVTHNMHQAGRIADKTAFFMEGRLIEYSTTRQLFLHPVDRRTEEYINGVF